MEFFTPLKPDRPAGMGFALVSKSVTPLLLLNEQLIVEAASASFCREFALPVTDVVGEQFLSLGTGEWNKGQLRSLLIATASGLADIEAYEFTLKRDGMSDRALIVHTHVLDHADSQALQLVLAISDVTAIRAVEEALRASDHANDALVAEKRVLLQELNHRVANSLQIIASILMQRVRSVQSEEARSHLRDAHHRVMSVASMQRLLASTAAAEVLLRPYLTDLCASIAASMISDPDVLSLTVIADDTAMNSDSSVSLGLIVTELAINSLKHAFPESVKAGKIDVTFVSNPDGWSLTVADNGIGIPDDDASAMPGLGTGIVNALAAQLKASVVVKAGNPGTTTIVARSAVAPAQ